VSYDLWQAYVQKDRDDAYYVRFGRLATVLGILIAILTAFIAKGYSNIMNYIQLLFSYFNAPLFATFIIAMFWRRATPWAGFWGLVAGTLGAFFTHFFYSKGTIGFGSDLAASFWGAGIAFAADAVVTVAVSLVTQPKPLSELQGLVYGTASEEETRKGREEEPNWWQRPIVLGAIAIALVVILNILFI
jgi:SSS family solute:Na+ symporter